MTKMEFLNRLKFLPLMALLTTVGCTQKEVYRSLPEGQYEVSFRATGLEIVPGGERETKADLPNGQTIRVAVYQGTQTAIEPKDYVANSSGGIIPQGGAQMTLQKGTFDFFAYGPTSLNLNTSARTISVDNGFDLIAASAASQVVGSSDRVVNLTFAHLCSKVEFAVGPESGYGVTDLQVSSATMTGMAPGPVTYTLGGTIAAGYSASATVGLTGFVAESATKVNTASTVVLPRSANDLTVSFTMSVDGGAAQTLTGSVSNIAFQAGKYYKFNAVLRSGELELELGVADWTDVVVPDGEFTYVSLGTWEDIDWGYEWSGEDSGGNTVGRWVENTLREEFDFSGGTSGSGVDDWNNVDQRGEIGA